MNFEESVKYLYGLGNEVLAMKLGLENIRKLLAALGNPEKNYLKVQIAGTNGKGSTVAFLESICVAAGIETGATVSPHLVSITERVRIGGREISEKDFAKYATIVRETSEKLVENSRFQIPNSRLENPNSKFQIPDSRFEDNEKESGIWNLESGISLETVPTFFEQVTAIALLAFSEAKVKLAILETGLGGRFDAMTAANAEIVAITPIDYDHQRILGDTLAQIASEKAAIIRQDTRVFVAPQKKEAEAVIYGKCRETGVDAIWTKPDVDLIEDLKCGILYLDFKTKKTNYKVDFSMQGKHQWTNANLAIAIAESLPDYGLKISKECILHGLETTKHPGRLEFRHGILFDGAHNASGAKVLREYLDEFTSQPITLVFGAMQDKDLSEIAEILFPKADKLIFTKADNPRSAAPEELARFTVREFHLTENVAEALKLARTFTANLICVTGSLYLIGEAQKILSETA